MSSSWRLVPILLVLLACTGRLEIREADARADSAGPDGGRLDGGLDDASEGVDSRSDDAGGRDSEPPDPCATLICGAHSRCRVDVCVCDEGFAMQGGECRASEVGDPATHSEAQVCARYRESQMVSPDFFVAGDAMCDLGTLTRGGIDDTTRRLNFYRWLCGVGPVSAGDETDNRQAQACAITSAWNPAGVMAHMPEPSATCYSADAAAGAGQSNIGWGVQSGPTLIDLFVADPGNETTLGHRRWCLFPPLGNVGVGIYHGGTSFGGAGCLKVFGTGGGGGSPIPDVVAYPPAGFVPVALLGGGRVPWSLASGGLSGPITVSVTRQSDEMALPTTIMPLADGYGSSTRAWSLDGWSPEVGQDYRVEVTDGTATIVYHVLPTGC